MCLAWSETPENTFCHDEVSHNVVMYFYSALQTILFTMDEQILEAVSQHDEAYEGEMLDEDEPFDVERPTTADDGGSGVGFTVKIQKFLTPQKLL